MPNAEKKHLDNIKHLPFYRLNNHQLSSTTLSSPGELVKYMGAMQSQDYAMSKWAVGIRLPGSTDQSIEDAINKGEVIRTHVLRPTWHLVSPDDVRWMLELSAEKIKKAMGPMNKQLEITEKDFTKGNKIILKALQSNGQMSRTEMMKELNETNGHRAAHLMLNAELDQIVCNGAMSKNESTYVLLDEKAPVINSIKKPEALGELTKRFFISHGPATLNDFTWWSGLSPKDAREGLENSKHHFHAETIEGIEYWLSGNISQPIRKHDALYFLPAFDEFIIGYKDRSASLHNDFVKTVITTNGIFKPMIIENGKVIGSWKRTFTKNEVIIETKLFVPSSKLDQKALELCQGRFESYFNKPCLIK